ncbi:hypothetical protein KDAU_54530 [Dictyobacter aurantiacus]|uniref:Uncharacterized protein n=1 Tax=Dictyobacter aurantiacus TaxID=1936993 RepID=A0A401ZMS3_9CHLR|nr:hypothetical protein KDAU_54530 [Dictyobacter aurantiacus]
MYPWSGIRQHQCEIRTAWANVMPEMKGHRRIPKGSMQAPGVQLADPGHQHPVCVALVQRIYHPHDRSAHVALFLTRRQRQQEAQRPSL